MAKINLKNKGLTLIELILYMSIFCFIFLIMMSSVFYLQKIIQTNNQNYYVKNQIYANLNILQQYLYKSGVQINNQELKIISKNGNVELTQKLENNSMKNTYSNKGFNPMENVLLLKYTVELIDGGRTLKVDFSWLDSREKTQNFAEYLIVINHIL